jgi:hypothetical protein
LMKLPRLLNILNIPAYFQISKIECESFLFIKPFINKWFWIVI